MKTGFKSWKWDLSHQTDHSNLENGFDLPTKLETNQQTEDFASRKGGLYQEKPGSFATGFWTHPGTTDAGWFLAVFPPWNKHTEQIFFSHKKWNVIIMECFLSISQLSRWNSTKTSKKISAAPDVGLRGATPWSLGGLASECWAGVAWWFGRWELHEIQIFEYSDYSCWSKSHFYGLYRSL